MSPEICADIVRQARAARLRTRGFLFLLRRQRKDMAANRERRWALQELTRMDWRDLEETRSIVHFTLHRINAAASR